MTLEKLVEMFSGQLADKHVVEIGLDDIRAWHAEAERMCAELGQVREILGNREAGIGRLQAALREIMDRPWTSLSIRKIAHDALEGE